MSHTDGSNTWYKYLESLKDRSAASRLRSYRDLLYAKMFGTNYPQFEKRLVNYQCLKCMKHILEVRTEICNHQFCATCLPRTLCPRRCKSCIIYSFREEDMKFHQVMLDDFKNAMGYKFVNVQGPEKKRKAPDDDDDDDDDEMSE